MRVQLGRNPSGSIRSKLQSYRTEPSSLVARLGNKKIPATTRRIVQSLFLFANKKLRYFFNPILTLCQVNSGILECQ
jgi:hypothetical protein